MTEQKKEMIEKLVDQALESIIAGGKCGEGKCGDSDSIDQLLKHSMINNFK